MDEKTSPSQIFIFTSLDGLEFWKQKAQEYYLNSCLALDSSTPEVTENEEVGWDSLREGT